MRFTTIIKAALPLAVAGALASSAIPAHAGVTPGVPSSSQMQTHRHDHFKPQYFTIDGVNNNDGVVNAWGVVNAVGTDHEVNPNFGVFNFGYGNTINVLHTNVDNTQPSVFDPEACTLTGYAKGSWLWDGGTGKYKRIFGFGKFKFTLTLFFKKHHHRCHISKKSQPKLVKFHVDAKGVVAVHRHHHDLAA